MLASPAKRDGRGPAGEGDAPLLSVLTVCKDSSRTIRRCVESLLRLDWPRVQLVVQDGASTDGTLEILRGYGSRLDLVSESDRDQNEAFVRGLRRCRGEFVAFCWADEELLPGAARRALEPLLARPELGAVYGDFVETDLDGRGDELVKYPDWSFERVFTYEFIPPLCSSFFRRSWIERTYLRWPELAPDATEYLLWASVGGVAEVEHLGEPLARYARHSGQLSLRPERMASYPAKVAAAIRGLAARPEMPPVARALERRACAHVHLWAAHWLACACGEPAAGRRHLGEALGYEPTPLRLTMTVLECLRHALAVRRPGLVLDMLEVTDRRGVALAGLEYARALALEAAGRGAEAREAERRVLSAPERGALLELLKKLLEDLARDGLAKEAERALGVLWRLGELDPALLYSLVALLGALDRPQQALVAARRFLEVSPGHPATVGLVDQLGLILCVKQRSLRRELASALGRAELGRREAYPYAQAVWQCLLDPEAAARLPGDRARLLGVLVSLFESTAHSLGLVELKGKLSSLSAALSRA